MKFHHFPSPGKNFIASFWKIH